MDQLLSFVHVGLPKCASTYVQAVWNKDDRFNLGEPSSIVQKAMEFTVQGLAGSVPLIKFDHSISAIEGKKGIASSEGFTWGFCNQPELQDRMDDLHRVSANLLAQAGITETIFLMVRNPVDWIRAVHEQSIRQGGSRPFKEFIREQRNLILGPLNLDLIIKEYQRYFPRMVILSSDELRRDPDSFWQKFSRDLDVPQPSPRTRETGFARSITNVSLSRRVYDLAVLNRHGARFMEVYLNLGPYQKEHAEEYAKFKSFLEANWFWLTRRVVEYATDEQLASLVGNLDQKERDSFQRIELDRELVAEINQRYLAPLEEYEILDPDLIREYKSSLAQVAVD